MGVSVGVGALVEVTLDVGMDMEIAVGGDVAVGTQAITSSRVSSARMMVVALRNLQFITASFPNGRSVAPYHQR